MNVGQIIVIAVIVFCAAYIVGRLFAAGIMDELNRKFHKFTKKEKDGNKEEK